MNKKLILTDARNCEYKVEGCPDIIVLGVYVDGSENATKTEEQLVSCNICNRLLPVIDAQISPRNGAFCCPTCYNKMLYIKNHSKGA